MHGLVQCDKVFVATSSDKGVGAFAACAISEGEIVERSIVRRLPATFDGNASPYVFTWSEDRTVGPSARGAPPSTTPLRPRTRRCAETSKTTPSRSLRCTQSRRAKSSRTFTRAYSGEAVSPICADLLGSGGPAPMLASQSWER